MSDSKWSAVKRKVESEIDKAKKYVGKAVEEFHHSEHGTELTHVCDDSGCSPRIPTPCWLPEDLGDLRVEIEREGTARLVVRVRNKDGQQRQVTAHVTGAGASNVVPVNGQVTVPAFGYGTFTFSVTVPSSAPVGTYVDVQIAIDGCRKHIMNWRVDALEKCDPEAKVNDEVMVCDGADNVHHWYDHFYCRRDCHATP